MWHWDDSFTSLVDVDSCGSTATEVHDLRAGARNVVVKGPRPGDAFQDQETGKPTMKVTGSKVDSSSKPPSVTWAFVGSGDICSNPSAYQGDPASDTPPGSEAEIPFDVRYTTKQRVYVSGDLTWNEQVTPAHRVFKPDYRPRKLRFYDSRGTGAHEQIFFHHLTGLKWKHWDGARADGRGTLRWNDCRPDCDHGHTHPYAVTVSLSSVAACSNDDPEGSGKFEALEYLGMHYRFVKARPRSAHRAASFKFQCPTVLVPPGGSF
jgi:hypothetical protein